MKSLIVFAHPEPKSFCGALFKTASESLSSKGEVVVSDLYSMNWHAPSDRNNFKSVSNGDYFKPQVEETYASEHGTFADDIEMELRKIEQSDLMVWVFPLWWFSVPAILKGWVDRVFVMGRVYGGGKIYETGAFSGKKAVLCLTTGGPSEAYTEGGFNGDISSILRPIHRGMLEFTGFKVLKPQIVYGPARMEEETRLKELENWRERLSKIESEEAILVGSY